MKDFIKKNKILFYIIILIIIIAIGLFNFVVNDNSAQASVSLKPKDKLLIKLGKKIYTQNCASCQGVNLEGEKNWMSRLPNGMMPAPPHDEKGHTWHHNDNYLFMITKYGVEEILSDKEIISVLSYIKSTWPPRVQKIHDQINSRSN